MPGPTYVILENRGLLGVDGEDARQFLQGLVSNDVQKVSAENSLYAAMLTPQGKFLYDFFLIEATGGGLLIDCELERLGELKRKLSMYRMRAKVEFSEQTPELAVAALFGDGVAAALGVENNAGATVPLAAGQAFIDPRLTAIGGRAVMPRQGAAERLEKAGFKGGEATDYERLRLACGLPDGSRDMVVDKAILLENGFDELHGVDWKKGCYMGQELTARTHYRGLIKKRLMPVRIEGPTPPPGSNIFYDGKAAGELRSVLGDRGLALIRLEQFRKMAAEGFPFSAGEAKIRPEKPDWAVFPEPQ